jgi:hypothetical protein
MTLKGIDQGAAPPAVGARFEDQRVAAAAKFAGIVDEYRERLDLGAIVVLSPRGVPLECDLQTMAGGVIKWGPIELPQSIIRRRLDDLATKTANTH